VAEFFIETLVGLLALFLWIVVVAFLVRAFGLRLPLGPFSSSKRMDALQALSFPKYVLVYGVLCFGCGMLIVTTVSHYVEWKYFHDSTPLTAGKFLADAVWWPIVSGVLFGLISWHTRSGNATR
jgi:hypothetical protein